ncbi:hypothetical protein TIFTF001_008401 [Ficus carica]|uniref:Uncharacterized protein n=1 Tax=Ficus carica TaxID=3494 RepID=A0AA88CXX8_FICCA|nr:hypothetical protein TIFTF001_008401 [Ficus carica]
MCSLWLIYEHKVANLVGNEISKIDVGKVAEEWQLMEHVLVIISSDEEDENYDSSHLLFLPIRLNSNNQSRSTERFLVRAVYPLFSQQSVPVWEGRR